MGWLQLALAALRGISIKKVLTFLPFKAWVALAFVAFSAWKASGYINYNAGVKDTVAKYAAMPATSTTKDDMNDSVRVETVKVAGRAVAVPDTAARRRVDSLLRAGVSKDEMIAKLTSKKESERVFSQEATSDSGRRVRVSGTLFLSFYPTENWPDGAFHASLALNPIPLPTRTITTTKQSPPILVGQNTFDIYMRGEIGGLASRRFMQDMAGSLETGVKVNIDKWHLSAAPAVGVMQGKAFLYYKFGVEVVPTQ